MRSRCAERLSISALRRPGRRSSRSTTDIRSRPISRRTFETPYSYAVGVDGVPRAEAFRCGSAGTVYLATDCPNMQAAAGPPKAQASGRGRSTITSMPTTARLRTSGSIFRIPPTGNTRQCFCAETQRCRDFDSGNGYRQAPVLRQYAINNVCMTILPNGEYIAACTGSTVENQGVSLFVSSDRGRRLEGAFAEQPLR